MFKITSIKYKTLFAILIVSTLTLGISSTIFVIYSTSMVKNYLVREIQLAGNLTGENLVVPLIFNDSIEGKIALDQLKNISFIENASVYKIDNSTFCSFQKTSTLKNDFSPILTSDYYFIDGHLYVGHIIEHENKILGYINICANDDLITSHLKKYAIFFTMILIALLVLSYILALYFQGRLTNPILKLINHTEEIQQSQNYSLSIETKGEDELAKLYDSFNHMISKIYKNSLQQNSDKNKIEKQNIELKHSFTKLEETNKELSIAKSKAEESDQLKSAFLANMSHEIRTPMNGILGFADLLRDPDMSGENQKLYIDIIHRSGQRLLTTVNDIIDISKIDAGQMEVAIQEMKVLDELKESILFFSPEAEKKGIELELIVQLSRDDLSIQTDSHKFLGILNNLIKNAIKFTKAGKVTVSCKQEKERLLCYVKDTGIGIPKDRQKAIFNRFEQADIYDIAVFEGSGLGLAIASSYAEMLNGKIWLESEEDIGSTFYFAHPISVKKIATDQSEMIPIDNTESMLPFKVNFLIVEDDQICFDHMSIILKKYAKSIVYAENGERAIELYNDEIDIVLMDLKMPKKNGYEATEEILKIAPQAKIIAQTAFASMEEREKCLSRGFTNYISKPIDKNKLLVLIKDVLVEG